MPKQVGLAAPSTQMPLHLAELMAFLEVEHHAGNRLEIIL
jgi:hypothetical protein